MRHAIPCFVVSLVVAAPMVVGCSPTTVLRATMGSSADTPSEAISEMQTGSPALENDLRGPGSMDLGMEVMSVRCDAAAEDRAYCDGNNHVECDGGSWRSVPCGAAPQYCGELEGVVGCYSSTNNDPEPGPDPVAEDDAAGDPPDAATPGGCPMVGGDYESVEVIGGGCPASGGFVTFVQTGCLVSASGGQPDGIALEIGPDGRSAGCGSNMICLAFLDGMATFSQDPCTFSYRRR